LPLPDSGAWLGLVWAKGPNDFWDTTTISRKKPGTRFAVDYRMACIHCGADLIFFIYFFIF